MWVMLNLSVCLEAVLVSVQDRCTLCAKCTIGPKLLLADQMVLLDVVDQVEDCLILFEDSVNLSARSVHGLCQMYHKLENHFGHTRWYT